jgi:hypothetical protein
MEDQYRDCATHGYTVYRYQNGGKRGWYSCVECVKNNWKKASAKRRTDPVIKEYHRQYSSSYNKIRKSLSIYLTMILLAGNIKPE